MGGVDERGGGGLSGYKRGSALGPVCVRWDPVHAMPSVWKREALRVDNYILAHLMLPM